ncbi:AMMECR1 domain protein [Methylocaldum marinum]|uniref:AMMECR1 domain protein n=2 Tax=Methylocaldum marinum TaxID=1432792 RepID=A0A286P4C9_9GAMM|nr:AmmeMemoRadiSam system protein A [Methylocaldum marinum]BBA37505.1 AMMECR1 domain protein [Methylocaldum marinum]
MSSSNATVALSPAQRGFLLTLARRSIEHGLIHGRAVSIEQETLEPELAAKTATFVTLEMLGKLRGCIGTLECVRSLAEDVAHNAHAAAFRDPRFPPVSHCDIKRITVSVSLLTPAEPLSFMSEDDLLGQLMPGKDGLILEEGLRRGTFLPTVWESLPHPRVFLQHLKLKAGLSRDYWSDSIKVYRYRTQSIEADWA